LQEAGLSNLSTFPPVGGIPDENEQGDAESFLRISVSGETTREQECDDSWDESVGVGEDDQGRADELEDEGTCGKSSQSSRLFASSSRANLPFE
jgi:hypothetical protein